MYILLIIITLILIGTIIISFSNKTSFEKDIFKKYGDNVKKIELLDSKNNNSKIIKDNDTINKIIEDLFTINMKKYDNEIPENIEKIYYIGLYNEESLFIGLTLYDNKYITIFVSNSSSSKTKTYRIRNNFNIDYINKLLK